MKVIGDETQRLNTMQAGSGDILWTVTTQTAEALRKANFAEFAAVQNGGPDIYFNMRAGKQFADRRARLAVTESIDRCDLVKTVLNGVVGCSDSIFRPNSPYYDPSIVQPTYNPTDAQNLFNQLAAENGGTYKINFTSFQYGNFPGEATYIQSKQQLQEREGRPAVRSHQPAHHQDASGRLRHDELLEPVRRSRAHMDLRVRLQQPGIADGLVQHDLRRRRRQGQAHT